MPLDITPDVPPSARAEIERLLLIGRQYAECVALEAEYEARRPIEKAEAIRRIMGQDNPDTGKPHSATSAEKLVEADPTYADFLREMRQATVNRIERRSEYEAQGIIARFVAGALEIEARVLRGVAA